MNIQLQKLIGIILCKFFESWLLAEPSKRPPVCFTAMRHTLYSCRIHFFSTLRLFCHHPWKRRKRHGPRMMLMEESYLLFHFCYSLVMHSGLENNFFIRFRLKYSLILFVFHFKSTQTYESKSNSSKSSVKTIQNGKLAFISFLLLSGNAQ